jgi:hypothetical protein
MPGPKRRLFEVLAGKMSTRAPSRARILGRAPPTAERENAKRNPRQKSEKVDAFLPAFSRVIGDMAYMYFIGIFYSK